MLLGYVRPLTATKHWVHLEVGYLPLRCDAARYWEGPFSLQSEPHKGGRLIGSSDWQTSERLISARLRANSRPRDPMRQIRSLTIGSVTMRPVHNRLPSERNQLTVGDGGQPNPSRLRQR